MNKIATVGELLGELNNLPDDTPVFSEGGMPLYVGLRVDIKQGNKFIIYGNFKDISVNQEQIEIKQKRFEQNREGHDRCLDCGYPILDCVCNTSRGRLRRRWHRDWENRED